MQRHKESISFGLFLSLNISGTLHLSFSDLLKLWKTQHLVSEVMNVETFRKNTPKDKRDENFINSKQMIRIISLLQNSFHTKCDNFSGLFGKKRHQSHFDLST